MGICVVEGGIVDNAVYGASKIAAPYKVGGTIP